MTSGSRCSRDWAACALAVVTLAVVALAVAGCGGSSAKFGNGQPIAYVAPVGPQLTRSQLVRRADAICKQRNTAIDAVKLSGVKPADVARFASESAALEHTAFDEMSHLEPPIAMASDWHQILAYTKTLLENVIVLGEYGEHGDTRVIPALSKATQAVKRRLLALATRAGFQHCSRLR